MASTSQRSVKVTVLGAGSDGSTTPSPGSSKLAMASSPGLAPTAGQVLTWSGSFYWRCRFKQSQIEFEQFMKQLWSARAVEFTTCKP